MTLRPPRALLLFAALAVAVGLTGCDYFPPDWPIDAFYDGADLRAGEWLDAYGEPQEEPCTPAPCISGAACIGQWTSEPTATPAGFSRAPGDP